MSSSNNYTSLQTFKNQNISPFFSSLTIKFVIPPFWRGHSRRMIQKWLPCVRSCITICSPYYMLFLGEQLFNTPIKLSLKSFQESHVLLFSPLSDNWILGWGGPCSNLAKVSCMKIQRRLAGDVRPLYGWQSCSPLVFSETFGIKNSRTEVPTSIPVCPSQSLQCPQLLALTRTDRASKKLYTPAISTIHIDMHAKNNRNLCF